MSAVIPAFSPDIFDTSPFGFFISTPEGHYLYTNTTFAAMTGYDSPEDLISSITDIATQIYADPSDRDQFMKLMREHGKVVEHECRFTRKDGSALWVSTSAHAVYGDDGKIIQYQGLHIDITARKKIVQELDAARTELSTVLDAIPALVWRKDIHGRYVHANRTFHDLTAIKPEDLRGKTDFDIHPRDIAHKYVEDDHTVIARKKPLRNITEMHRKSSGQTGWSLTEKLPFFDGDGQLTGTLGFALDITDLKSTQDKLRKSREQQRILLDNIQTQIWYLTDEHFYGAVNKAHAAFLGFAPQDIAKKDLREFLDANEVEICRQGNRDVFTRKQPIHTEELLFNGKGEKRLLSIIKTPKLDDQGNVEYVVCSAEDITEQRQTEEALRRSEARYRLFADNAMDAFYLADASGRLIDVNARATLDTGFSRQELLDMHIWELDAKDSKQDFFALWSKVADNSVNFISSEHRRKDGTRFPVEINAMCFTQDGDMLGRVYCYRDHRLDAMIEQVKARIDAERLYTITGIHFQPFNISNQLLWFMLNRAELLQPGTFYLPVPALFYYYLGGGRYVDSSWASVTQLMDAATKNWSVEVLDALAIPHAVMPEIVAPGARVGALTRELAERLTLNEAPLVAVAAHDTASAFAAAPVSDPARALIISSGTWSLVGKLVDRPFTTREAMQANLSNEGGIGNIRLLKNCMGGWLVQELRRVWRVADGCEMDWKTMDSLTEQAAPFAALIDPDDAAFYNPANMEAAIAEFCRRTGQCVPEGRGAFMRVVYESLALKYRLINEQICGVTGSTTEVVHVVGGGSKNILLNQFAADALGLPVIAGPEEATAVGNIMVQAIGIGRIGSMAEAQPMIRSAFPIREYRPRNTGAWDAPYARFRDLCGA